jgi:hypothetical protein
LLSGVANTVNSALVHPPRFGNSARFAHVNVRHHFGHASGATSQGATTSADPSAAASTSTTSTAPNADARAQLQTDMAKLRSDAESIRAKSTVTPDQLAKVRSDFQAIGQALHASGQTPAGPRGPLGEFRGGPDLMGTDTSALKDKLTALGPQGVSSTLVDQTLADVQAVQQASNVTAADQQTLQADHKAVEADLAALGGPQAGSRPDFPGHFGPMMGPHLGRGGY